MVYIMPYMEHKDVYDHWVFSTTVIQNKTMAQTDIKEFYCPSRRNTVRPGDVPIMFNNWTTGGTDYGGCMGRVNGWDNDMSDGKQHKICGPGYVCYGANIDPVIGPNTNSKAGIFFPNSRTTFQQITDGSSHTIMIGELQRLLPPGAPPPDQAGNSLWAPSRTSCDGWAVGGPSTLFDCAVYGEGTDKGQPGGINNQFFEDAGSEHPGGAQFGAADGSIQFISTNINSQTYAYLGSMADTARVQFP
jgi:hypothetical protein